MSDDIVIAAARRTPIGSFQGALSSLTAPQLGAAAVRAALADARVDGAEISEVIMGCVLPAGLGQALQRLVEQGGERCGEQRLPGRLPRLGGHPDQRLATSFHLLPDEPGILGGLRERGQVLGEQETLQLAVLVQPPLPFGLILDLAQGADEPLRLEPPGDGTVPQVWPVRGRLLALRPDGLPDLRFARQLAVGGP